MLRKRCYRRKYGQTDRAKFFGLPGDMEKVLQKVVQNWNKVTGVTSLSFNSAKFDFKDCTSTVENFKQTLAS